MYRTCKKGVGKDSLLRFNHYHITMQMFNVPAAKMARNRDHWRSGIEESEGQEEGSVASDDSKRALKECAEVKCFFGAGQVPDKTDTSPIAARKRTKLTRFTVNSNTHASVTTLKKRKLYFSEKMAMIFGQFWT